MFKQAFFLMTGCMLLSACKSSAKLQKSETQSLVSRLETSRSAKTDSLSEHKADSVFVFVRQTDSMLHLVKETTHWREKIKVVKDTVVVNVQADTVFVAKEVGKKTIRSPPSWKHSLVLILLLTAVICQVFNRFKK